MAMMMLLSAQTHCVYVRPTKEPKSPNTRMTIRMTTSTPRCLDAAHKYSLVICSFSYYYSIVVATMLSVAVVLHITCGNYQEELDNILGFKSSVKTKAILATAILRHLLSSALQITMLSGSSVDGSYFSLLILDVCLTDGAGFILCAILIAFNPPAQLAISSLFKRDPNSKGWRKPLVPAWWGTRDESNGTLDDSDCGPPHNRRSTTDADLVVI